MQQFYIDNNQPIWILLANCVQDTQKFNEEIAMNENCIFALVNPEYLVTLQACLIAIYRMLKTKQYQTSMQFQKDLHYLLTPEEVNNDNRFAVTKIQTQKFLCVFLTNVNQNQLDCFDLDEITNLYQCCNIPETIKYYKIGELELKVEKDLRGAIYNQIVLKKFK